MHNEQDIIALYLHNGVGEQIILFNAIALEALHLRLPAGLNGVRNGRLLREIGELDEQQLPCPHICGRIIEQAAVHFRRCKAIEPPHHLRVRLLHIRQIDRLAERHC